MAEISTLIPQLEHLIMGSRPASIAAMLGKPDSLQEGEDIHQSRDHWNERRETSSPPVRAGLSVGWNG